MGTALTGIDVVYEGVNLLIILVVVLKSDFNEHIVLLTLKGNGSKESLLILIEVLDEFTESAFGMEGLLLFLFTSSVIDGNPDSVIEIAQRTETV